MRVLLGRDGAQMLGVDTTRVSAHVVHLNILRNGSVVVAVNDAVGGALRGISATLENAVSVLVMDTVPLPSSPRS